MFSLICPLSPAAACVLPFFLTLLASSIVPLPRSLSLHQFTQSYSSLPTFPSMLLEDHSRSQEEPGAQEESYPYFHIHKSPRSKEKAVTLKIYSVLEVLKPGSTKCEWHLQNSTKLPRSVHSLCKSSTAWRFLLCQTPEKLFLLQYAIVII